MSAPFDFAAPPPLPARTGRFGGFAPPLDAVERTPLFFDSGTPEISSPFGTKTTLPGAGTRWRELPVRLFMVRGAMGPAPSARAARGAGLRFAVVATASAISALDFVRRTAVAPGSRLAPLAS